MADNGSSNTGVVAVLVIFVIVAAGLFFAWQGGMLGGHSTTTEHKLDVDIQAPAPSQQQPSSDQPASGDKPNG